MHPAINLFNLFLKFTTTGVVILPGTYVIVEEIFSSLWLDHRMNKILISFLFQKAGKEVYYVVFYCQHWLYLWQIVEKLA